MANYAGFQEKLKRRLEAVSPKPDELAESRKLMTTLIEKLLAYFKGNPKDNPAGVSQLEVVGGMAEGTCTSTIPSFDVFVMIRPNQQCRLSDPEPPMGVVVPTVFVRRQSMESSTWRDFTTVVPPGNKHQIVAEKVYPHIWTLVDKAIEYQRGIDTFKKVNFKWCEFKNTSPQVAVRKCMEIIDRPTGKASMTVNFFTCLEVDEEGIKYYPVACNDNQWRLSFALRERDLCLTADKADSGCRVGCCTLLKALIKGQYPELAKNGRAQQIAKSLLTFEMHETANAATKWRHDLYGDRFFCMLNHLSSSLQEGKMEHAYGKFMGGKANILEGVSGLAEIKKDLDERIKTPDTKLLPAMKST